MPYIAVPVPPSPQATGYRAMGAGVSGDTAGYVPVPPTVVNVPLTVAGLRLWLRADLGITQAGTVSAWADQSGLANSFSQAVGGSQPLYVASAINGLPGVQGAAGKFMSCGTDAVGQNAARTHFGVLTVSTDQQPMLSARSNGGYAPILASGLNTFVETNQTTTNNTDVGTIAAGNHIFQMSFDGVQANVPVLKIDNVARTVVNGAGAGVGAEIATASMQLGGNFTGTLCEFLTYDSVLSAGDATTIYNYLKVRYGL
jgi:hypothetical protein